MKKLAVLLITVGGLSAVSLIPWSEAKTITASVTAIATASVIVPIVTAMATACRT